MSQYRQEKVQERIREILNTVFRFHTKDPSLHGVYVLEVRVTADLRLARVYWRSEAMRGEDGRSLTGHVASERDINKALKRAAGFLRKQVADQLKIRFAPELQFFRDETLEQGERIIDLIRTVMPEEAEASSDDDAREDPGWETDLGPDGATDPGTADVEDADPDAKA